MLIERGFELIKLRSISLIIMFFIMIYTFHFDYNNFLRIMLENR